MMATKGSSGPGFLIKIGNRFYAGESREIKEVTLAKNIDISKKSKWKWGGYFGPPRRNNTIDRARRKGNLATYLAPRKQEATTETRRQLTGKTFPKLADSQQSAKLFNSKKAAESACERIKRLYVTLSIDVSIVYHRGESNERS